MASIQYDDIFLVNVARTFLYVDIDLSCEVHIICNPNHTLPSKLIIGLVSFFACIFKKKIDWMALDGVFSFN